MSGLVPVVNDLLQSIKDLIGARVKLLAADAERLSDLANGSVDIGRSLDVASLIG